MAVIKCKMCGGDLKLIPGESVLECEYCGSRQTVPAADNEKKLTLFARANRLRAGCEFDKAAGIYESIVADFPEEAEAYWGLVLCKYGIEYVDDPATGRKIPTCHRSSFDSVMDDSNFEQAMENSDEVALRVYRQEAKQIEEIRKGILEVSSSEKPYDIFICYKETDTNGDRTVDSLLAQDIYDALTSKGYRVFFSRITLEDKLGQAYEPYIFAALNSAKIMLAVGTCYEHYNAVWVKNEWSRYLKIIAQDKNKYLIPCYKGLDAYDIPKEFAHLQGQDMSKVGAIADLLRGIEKLIPRQKSNTVVVQEKVVVGGTVGSNKIASLLDRGNMALEDGDWVKADDFFEDVLSNDSRNAQAYIGKTLAQEKCRTMDALVRKRKDVYQNVSSEKLYIQERTAHIAEMAEKYALPGYVEQHTIRDLYRFDLSYTSEVSYRQKQCREEESWWQNHRWLSRAEKFAVGAVAEHLQSEKKHLFTQLNDRVKKAQEADARSTAKLEAAYDAHIAEADKQAEQLYNDGLARREKDYQNWLEQAKKENDPLSLRNLANHFTGLGDYKDSKNLSEHCRKRADEEQAKIDAEQERKRVQREQQEAAQRKKQKTIAVVSCAAIAAIIAVVLVVTKVIIPGNRYKAAEALLADGQYKEAIVAFEALEDYRDSQEKISECEKIIKEHENELAYQNACQLMAEGRYEEAIADFESLGGYGDSAAKISECEAIIQENTYQKALTLIKEGKEAEALSLLDTLDGYQNTEMLRKEILEDIREYIVPYQTAFSTGGFHTVGLKSDGTVVAVGDNDDGQCDISDWSGIVAVSAGGWHTVGLKSDGTVVAVGYNDDGQCDISGWSDIVAVSAGDSHTVGLKSNGTVVAVGSSEYGKCDVTNWQDIVAVSAGSAHTVGLKSDGTVVAVGWNNYGQCNVADWQDIVAVSAGVNHTVGLKSDGTVVAVGSNKYGKCDVSDWRDIVAVFASAYHTVGSKSDGTVMAVGNNEYGKCNVFGWTDSGWTDIVAVSAGVNHTVGLKSNGTVVAVGSNSSGQCGVADWKNIGPAK